MKTSPVLLLTFISIAGAHLSHATVDSSVLAHWDMNDGSDTYARSIIPQAAPHHCVNVENMFAVHEGSYSTSDSENGSIALGANCFADWNNGQYISFRITTDANAAGNINLFNFDIANYGGADDPDQYKVFVFKNNSLVSYSDWIDIDGRAPDNQGGTGSWTGSFNQNYSTSPSWAQTSEGSSDTFEFRIVANSVRATDGRSTTNNGRIAIDNVRLIGHIDCIPEPQTALLGLLGALSMLARRKR